MKKVNFYKIHTYCPKEVADKVRLAIGDAGGGKLGNYSYCAWTTPVQGYFMPMEGAHPTIGEIGKMETIEEIKIEFICEKDKIKQVIEAIKKAHPYEEVPIDVIQLVDVEG